MITADIIHKSLKAFVAGKRPEAYRPSQYWFVLGPDAELLPAKAIWSLATGVRGANFNTTHAVRGLAELGFSVVDIRHGNDLIDFEKQVVLSLKTPPKERRKRLAVAPKLPKSRLIMVKQFVRNPDVVAEVLFLAKGKCQGCGKRAPFVRYSDGEPYLEVHHRRQLSQGGEDTVSNAIALCPNCHRQQHYGEPQGAGLYAY